MSNGIERKYYPQKFESYWRQKWSEEDLYNTDNKKHENKPKYYCLDMFPYPSGSGLHVGHWKGYVLSDVWSRYKMLQGFNLLHPMGWDNFGLPAENDAIKKGIHPKRSTKSNIDNMKRQLKEIGCSYDWSKEINTTDPDYYKWTQWVFLKMFRKGLAYQKLQPVNWCNDCKVVLANEEVEGGKCERCGGENIEKRNIKQWMLKITKYADRLLNDLEYLNWPDKVKEMQRNWIGKREGALVRFAIQDEDNFNKQIEIFTTRPDTIFGVTFIVLAPENPIIKSIVSQDRQSEVNYYISKSSKLSNIERQKSDNEKTGVFTGAYAINPINQIRIPIWISDYVLMDYGTGAVMAVPAHDERDFDFAKKFNLPIREVIYSKNTKRDQKGALLEAYADKEGILINSDYLNGLDIDEATKKVIDVLEKSNSGSFHLNYKLRDWIFARQRYWGEPIPVIHCDKCGVVPVPDHQLPVQLPDVEIYEPTDDGKSPLSKMDSWVNTTCPCCKGKAKRETDTMPQWAGSSWYFLRYPSHDYNKGIVSQQATERWLPVDMYVGGIEHAVLHLLYARFWTKFLYDEGVVNFEEPFEQLFNQGMVCRIAYKCAYCNRWIPEDEILKDSFTKEVLCKICKRPLIKSMEKMSKSKGNGISPDSLVIKYGTDALRLYELFIGDPAQDSEWNDDGIKACFSFLKRAWNFILENNFNNNTASKKAKQLTHMLVKNIDNRLNLFKFNTTISAFMEFLNEAITIKNEFSKELIEIFVITLSPFAPHFAEEIWRNVLNHTNSVFLEKFPIYDEEITRLEVIDIIVQVNGKVKGRFLTKPESSSKELEFAAKELIVIQELMKNNEIKKVIVVPNRIVNFVI